VPVWDLIEKPHFWTNAAILCSEAEGLVQEHYQKKQQRKQQRSK